MYHIVKSKSKTKPISVVQTAKNGEPLNFHPLKTVQAAFKNIVARLVDVENSDKANPELYTYVQDETKKVSKLFRVYNSGPKALIVDATPAPRYVPGRNIKKKD